MFVRSVFYLFDVFFVCLCVVGFVCVFCLGWWRLVEGGGHGRRTADEAIKAYGLYLVELGTIIILLYLYLYYIILYYIIL